MKKLILSSVMLGQLSTLAGIGDFYSHDKKYESEAYNCAIEARNATNISKILREKFPTSDYAVEYSGIKLTRVNATLMQALIELTTDNTRFAKQKHKSSMDRILEIVDRDELEECNDVICLAEAIFGKAVGSYYLYFFLEYNLNLSPYAASWSSGGKKNDYNRFAGAVNFTLDELQAVHTALSIFPKSYFNNLEIGQEFKRIKRYKGSTLANATMSYFNLWAKYKQRGRVETVIHELGHVFADNLAKDIEAQEDWYNISNWKFGDDFLDIYKAKPGKRTNFVSQYSKQNPVEDFAESFSAYILNPAKLQLKAPKKFEFISKYVFANSYDHSNCNVEKSFKDKLELAFLEKTEDQLEDLGRVCGNKLVAGIYDQELNPYYRCLGSNALGLKYAPIPVTKEIVQETLINQEEIGNTIFASSAEYIMEDVKKFAITKDDYLGIMFDNFKEKYREGNKDVAFTFGYKIGEFYRWTGTKLRAKGLENTEENARAAFKEVLMQRTRQK